MNPTKNNYSTGAAFAALKADGSIMSWGDVYNGYIPPGQRVLCLLYLGNPTL
jgi:hypothetical protein